MFPGGGGITGERPPLYSAHSNSQAQRPAMYGTFGSNWKQAGQWDEEAMGARPQQKNMSKQQAWMLGILPPGVDSA